MRRSDAAEIGEMNEVCRLKSRAEIVVPLAAIQAVPIAPLRVVPIQRYRHLPIYKRFLAYRADSYIMPKGYYESLLYNHKKYLIVCCPTRNISRKIKNIIYIYK